MYYSPLFSGRHRFYPFIDSAVQSVDDGCLNSFINTAPHRLLNDPVKLVNIVTQRRITFALSETLLLLMSSLQYLYFFNPRTFSCLCLLSDSAVLDSNAFIRRTSASLIHIQFCFVQRLHPQKQLTFRFRIQRADPNDVVREHIRDKIFIFSYCNLGGGYLHPFGFGKDKIYSVVFHCYHQSHPLFVESRILSQKGVWNMTEQRYHMICTSPCCALRKLFPS